MGYIQKIIPCPTETLVLTADDLKKRQERQKQARDTKPGKYQEALCRRLRSCPVCGEKPEVAKVQAYRSGRCSYKLFCSGNGTHMSCGEWFTKMYKAAHDWNKRVAEECKEDKALY